MYKITKAWHLRVLQYEANNTKQCNCIFNPFSAGTVFIRQNLQSVDRLYTSKSAVCRRQILTYKDIPRTLRIKIFFNGRRPIT